MTGSKLRPGPLPVSGGERLSVVAGEKHDVGGRPAGYLGDRGGDGRRLPAPVVRVVLEQALDLPGRQDALQALGEGAGWYVDKGDVPAEGGGQRRGDVRVRDRRGAGHGVGRAIMPGFGERGGGYRGDVADVHRADR